MRAVFPGKPHSKLQAHGTAVWDGRRIITYISGRALIILDGPNSLIQTITISSSLNDSVSSKAHSRRTSTSSFSSLLFSEEDLTATAINEISGKIAVSTPSKVFVYQPIGRDVEGVDTLKWVLQHTLSDESGPNAVVDSRIACLSWGPPDELLVGGEYLTVYATDRDSPFMWRRRLASPAKFTAFNPDGSLIATTGWHDRLVKVGRRQFLGEGRERRDVSYLPHPTAVTGLRWRGRPEEEQYVDSVLYTTCADHVLRIWAATNLHGPSILQLWVKMDLLDCVQPRIPLSPGQERRRYVVMVDNWDFTAAVQAAAMQTTGSERDRHARDQLKEIVSNNPELCIVLDDRGNMSAWGLERVGCKDRQEKDIYNITHIEDLNINFRDNLPPREQNLNCVGFASRDGTGNLSLLAHFFDGRLEWLQCPVDKLLDPSPATNRLTVKASWTGHPAPVLDLFSSPSRRFLISRSSDGEAIFWNSSLSDSTLLASPLKYIRSRDSIQGLYPSNDGRLVVVVYNDHVSLKSLGERINRPTSSSSSLDSPLERTPSQIPTYLPFTDDPKAAYFSMFGDNAHVLIWRSDESVRPTGLTKWADLKLDFQDDDLVSLPRAPIIEGCMDTVACASISTSGVLRIWSVPPTCLSHSVGKPWPVTKCMETGIKGASKVFVGPQSMMGIVCEDRSSFWIWDTESCHLDFHVTFQEHETIESLDWFSKDEQTVLLAVVFARRVLVYVQNLHDISAPQNSWICLNQIDISQITTLPISNSIWLANGDILVAAGNQMFLYDGIISVPVEISSSLNLPAHETKQQFLLNVASGLNYLLPAYHSQFLLECILSGKYALAQAILLRLNETLKFYSPGDALDSSLGFDGLNLAQAQDKLSNETYTPHHYDDTSTSLSEEIGLSLNQRLSSINLPFISATCQTQLTNLITSIYSTSKHQQHLDSLALSYLSILSSTSSTLSLSWRECCYAYFSTTSDILLHSATLQLPKPLLWSDAKRSGLFTFNLSTESLHRLFEDIGRNVYNATKNPVDCSLFYLALRKKSVLIGLWRLASWNKERGPTTRLLANDFSEARWRTAALKNAYALLGRRRFEYAAAFFLLADHLKDAVGVLANQCEDVQLAIAVARVCEGDKGPVLRNLLHERVLPAALERGDRWCAIWSLWMLGEQQKALLSFVDPLSTGARFYWTNNEACLAYLYRHIRETSAKDPRNAVHLSPEDEWVLVSRSARAYRKSGCYTLALDLIKSWKFSDSPTTISRKKLDGDSTGIAAAAAEVAIHDDSASTSAPVLVNGDSSVQPASSIFADYLDSDTKAAPLDVYSQSQTQTQAQVNGHSEDKAPASSPVYEHSDKNNKYKYNTKVVVEEPSAASILDNFDF